MRSLVFPLCLIAIVAPASVAVEPPSAEALEAQSWRARGELGRGQLDEALADARATRAGALALLKTRPLDAEPHLPIALGAAIEVEAQVLARRGERAQAIASLERDHERFAGTSIATRIQKNLNLLTIEGKPAPPLEREPHLGPPVPPLRGKPVLLFLWAHWCGECHEMAPVVARLVREWTPRGLVVVAPTQPYGAVGGEAVSAEAETGYIDRVRRRFYDALGDVAMPVNTVNFQRYGASTVPTIVLLDRAGKVLLYHPGAMTYDELLPRVAAAFK